LLIGAALLSMGVLWLLALATWRQAYGRVGPESAHVRRAHRLRDYHRQAGLTGADLDMVVALDLREQLIEDYARVIPANQALTLRRYGLRARAVTSLIWSLLLALIATIVVLVAA
jgi:hypothetical protein